MEIQIEILRAILVVVLCIDIGVGIYLFIAARRLNDERKKMGKQPDPDVPDNSRCWPPP